MKMKMHRVVRDISDLFKPVNPGIIWSKNVIEILVCNVICKKNR